MLPWSRSRQYVNSISSRRTISSCLTSLFFCIALYSPANLGYVKLECARQLKWFQLSVPSKVTTVRTEVESYQFTSKPNRLLHQLSQETNTANCLVAPTGELGKYSQFQPIWCSRRRTSTKHGRGGGWVRLSKH